MFVQVRASAIFIPEFTDLLDSGGNYQFSYSIRMSLQPEGCIMNGMTFSSCQLHLRHWIIRANDYVVSRVNGEAVIGKVIILYVTTYTVITCNYIHVIILYM